MNMSLVGVAPPLAWEPSGREGGREGRLGGRQRVTDVSHATAWEIRTDPGGGAHAQKLGVRGVGACGTDTGVAMWPDGIHGGLAEPVRSHKAWMRFRKAGTRSQVSRDRHTNARPCVVDNT